jgi:hypothetical protein
VEAVIKFHTKIHYHYYAAFSADYTLSRSFLILAIIYLYDKFVLLVGDHLVLRDFGPYGIIFMNVCFVTTVTMVMLLRGFGPYIFYLYVGW